MERRVHCLENKEYRLRYTPSFDEDFTETVRYIAEVLQNPQAAEKLIDDTEKLIMERLKAPCAYQQFQSVRVRKHPYYRINVHHYAVFYVVIEDVMEIRRFLYSGRELEQIL